MKQTYEEAALTIIVFSAEDIITTSGDEYEGERFKLD